MKKILYIALALLLSTVSTPYAQEFGACAFGSTCSSGGGGGSAPTAGVTGSVQFSDGAGGHLADAPNFFWDNASDFLGIGIAAPTSKLHLPLEDDAVTPTLSFGDGDTGFYESVDDTLRITQGGINRWTWTSTAFQGVATGAGAIFNTNSSNIVPSFSPDKSDSDTGIGTNAADQISLIAGGLEMLRLVETGVATTDQLIIGPAGIIGDTATPSLAWGDGDSGIFEQTDDNLRVTISGAIRWGMDNTVFGGVVSDRGQIRNVAASLTVPTYTFAGDADTGISKSGTDQISLVSGGLEMLRLSETGVSTTDQLIIAPAGVIGAAATPSLAWGDGDSGIYENADDSFRWALGGSDIYNIATSGIGSATAGSWRLENSSASATNPTIQPDESDTDTGIGQAAGDQLSLIAGGVEAIRMTEATTIQINMNGRVNQSKGADVASGTDITLSGGGNYFDITGTTTIDTIASTNWTAGSIVILQFDASVTVSHNTAGTGASILLSGAANFSATLDDTLMLVFDGTTWRETSRTAI